MREILRRREGYRRGGQVLRGSRAGRRKVSNTIVRESAADDRAGVFGPRPGCCGISDGNTVALDDALNADASTRSNVGRLDRVGRS